ncbi:NAD-dependent epimerase/dehydratase family protein [Streptomyces chartreusis]|uniref:NAD-dependent epimerase/dehydratase family protein n=1 Tax=Streptomyces chartreusis TaxID=1969 RepID=UPI003626F434
MTARRSEPTVPVTTPPAKDTPGATAGAVPDTVLVVGGTGFIGSAVSREMIRAVVSQRGTPTLRVMSRTTFQRSETAGVRHVTGDLSDPRSLRGVCSGVDSVVHAASYVGRDPQRCTDVNVKGTRALLAEANRSGVRRFVYVSTASVYGAGPHRGLDERQLEPDPASPASASRFHAEQEVRAAGGIVLRPHLVYGAGDRWFVPTVVRLLHLLPAWPIDEARSSLVAVEDLARVAAAVADGRVPLDRGGTYHVAHPRPVSMALLLAKLRTAFGLPEPRGVPIAEHRALVRQTLPEVSDHQYALLTEDHWYDTSAIWRDTGLDPGPGFERRFASCSNWYREHVAHGLSSA